MKILHVSSFVGNIGDNASHIGTYSILSKFFNYSIDQLEIRKAYENYTLPDKWKFGYEFVRLANKYDLLLMGGGAFFDYFIDNSITGTTVDMTEDMINSLTVPTVVMSMGCLPRGGEHNYHKVSRFLDCLKNKAHIFFRNDGSYYPGIPQVLDSGFFYDNYSDFRIADNYTAVSVGAYELGDYDVYLDGLVRFISGTPGPVVLVPHILSDMDVINQLLKRLHLFSVAEKVTVAPYQQGWDGCQRLFSIYKNSRQVVATRYHANVCSIAMGKPCVGIAVSPKVDAMYQSLGASAVKAGPLMHKELTERFGEVHNIDSLKQDTLNKYGAVLTEFKGGK